VLIVHDIKERRKMKKEGELKKKRECPSSLGKTGERRCEIKHHLDQESGVGLKKKERDSKQPGQ